MIFNFACTWPVYDIDPTLNSQKTHHTSPWRASYGVSFVSISDKNDRVIKSLYCTRHHILSFDRIVINICTVVDEQYLYQRYFLW